MAESKSEYELQREARIKRNNEVMEQLGLSDAAEALRATRPKQKKQRTEKLPAAEPARRSTRQRVAPGDPLDAAKSWMASHGFGDSTVTPAARATLFGGEVHGNEATSGGGGGLMLWGGVAVLASGGLVVEANRAPYAEGGSVPPPAMPKGPATCACQ